MRIKFFCLMLLLLIVPCSGLAEELWATGGNPPDTLPGVGGLTGFNGLNKLTGRLGGGNSNNPPPPAINNSEMPQVSQRKTKSVTEKQLSQQAFDEVVNNALPMTPEQIIRLHALFNETQRAVATNPSTPPRPVSRTLPINLSPGTTPPVIRLYTGYISSLVFLDSTGAPWPIEAYDLGNPNEYNISWNQRDNLLLIQALTLAKHCNLMVKLRTLQTPIMLTLIPDQQAVDYRVDLQVPGIGPQAKALPITSGLPASATPILLNILNGVPPVGSKALEVMGAKAQAWIFDKKLYLRTQCKVLSPGWLAVMSSADGTNAYELPRTPYLLVTEHGKTINIKVSGF